MCGHYWPYGIRYEMYIADLQPYNRTILTKCSKMTEEGHNRRHGMNGNAVDGSFIKEECSKTNYVQGGRLKFFKGTSILKAYFLLLV